MGTNDRANYLVSVDYIEDKVKLNKTFLVTDALNRKNAINVVCSGSNNYLAWDMYVTSIKVSRDIITSRVIELKTRE